ncbi:MAG: 4Fe-4S binding protein [Gemmatimonadota bacterium]|nr:4Fe-4S binding protein [Gemmatimonadota bacterium]
MKRFSRTLLCVASLVVLLPAGATAQRIRDIDEDLMHQVMPGVDHFTEWGSDPTVMRAFGIDAEAGEEALLGYVFHTADVPPERSGYSAPIGTLVGLALDGSVTGMRITDYRESMRSSRGDFLRPYGFQEQYEGKHISEAFRPFRDVESISRATVSVRALSLGLRNAARRVANVYFPRAAEALGVIADVNALSWLELREAGVVKVMIIESSIGNAEMSLVHRSDDVIGERMVGTDGLAMAHRAAESAGGGHLFAYGVDGPRLRYFDREGWSVVQDGDTIATPEDQVLPFGLAAGGLLYDQVRLTGAMILDASIDVNRPFEILFDLRPNLDLFAVEYLTLAAREAEVARVEAEAAAAAQAALDAAAAAARSEAVSPATGAPASGADGSDVVDGATAATDSNDGLGGAQPGTADASAETTGAGATPASESLAATPLQDLGELGFEFDEDETILSRALERTEAKRLGAMAFVLLLATMAFFLKKASVRAVSLAVTLVFLGWIDGGFLSVSHITAGIWRGPSVYFDDLALLLMVTFTVIATLLFGRIFCGFLCPFGALQDLLDKIVPARLQKEIPQGVHDRALWVKYGLLAGILIPALAGSHTSLYQYVEPFGTVFFPSTSVLLWAIALAFLVASAIVPRFYCRYVCPLGAALAIGSLVSLKRIRRVEQCSHCKVCEQNCPTGAIRDERVDFKECVRCNVCETKLIEKAGVCKHDMEDVRPRLVQLKVSGVQGASGG